jgi:hypothetical protein
MRTQHPVKYYWINFDLSDEYDPSKGLPFVVPGHGGTRNVPEFSFRDRKCNPFAVDVWCLGFMIQVYFTEISPHAYFLDCANCESCAGL